MVRASERFVGEVPLGRSGHQGQGRRAGVFARIASGDDTWRDFEAIAAERQLTTARADRLLAEHGGHRELRRAPALERCAVTRQKASPFGQ